MKVKHVPCDAYKNPPGVAPDGSSCFLLWFKLIYFLCAIAACAAASLAIGTRNGEQET
jgi:hypothetical protein